MSTSARLHSRRGGIDPAGILFSLFAVALATGAVTALRPFAPVLSLGVLYLFAVLALAVAWGLAYALAVSIASLLAFNFLFLPPVYTFALRDSGSWVALAVYLVTAVVISELAARARRRATTAEQQRVEMAFAADVSAALLEDGRVEDKLAPLGVRVASVLGAAQARIDLHSRLRPREDETAFDLVAGGRQVGLLLLAIDDRGDHAATERVLGILASLLGSAVERQRFADASLEAEELRRSDAIKTTILRSLSHDLRSPLTTIAAAGDVLGGAAEELTPSQRTELIASIQLETRRLTRLVSNLLDLSRLEAGAARPRAELWTVDGLVGRALEALSAGAERVVVALPIDSPTLHVDPAQLERVLVNLLENALRFSSPRGQVELQTAVGDAEVILRIVDRGPGLSPDELARVFEPFEHAAAASGGGSGLGLAIARGFAQVNGGRVWAEPTPGGGATFAWRFRSPRREPWPACERSPRTRRRRRSADPAGAADEAAQRGLSGRHGDDGGAGPNRRRRASAGRGHPRRAAARRPGDRRVSRAARVEHGVDPDPVRGG
jgi:two-component system sensor histidine kinase KdpD